MQDHVRALRQKGYLAAPPRKNSRSANAARSFQLTHQAAARSIPILGTIPAGNPIEAIEDRQGGLSVSDPRGRALSGELFALKVRGESMRDAGILEGDYVIVQRTLEARHGEIVVAMIDGEATVKRLESRGGRMRLLPENPAFSPIELKAGRDNAIQGRVISVQRFLG